MNSFFSIANLSKESNKQGMPKTWKRVGRKLITNKMKKIFSMGILFSSIICFSQKQYYATILDADNNPQARGIFLNVLDTGVTIEVDKTPVFVNISNIYTIRIEKNTTKLEFMKLGAAAATQTAAKLLDHGSDSIGVRTKEVDKKKPMLENLQELLNSLLDQDNQVASFRIDGSVEALKNKLTILQQYSAEEEPQVKPLVPTTVMCSPKIFSINILDKSKPLIPDGAVILPTRPGKPVKNTVVVPTKPGNVTVPAKSATKSTKTATILQNQK
jgi:hypothetical protein